MTEFFTRVEKESGLFLIPYAYVSPIDFLSPVESDFFEWVREEAANRDLIVEFSSHDIMLYGATEDEATEFAMMLKLTWFND